MMRIFLLSTAVALLYINSFGQVSFGIKGGLSFNSVVNNDVATPYYQVETTSVTSFHLGAFSKIALSDKFYLLPELQYIQKGFEKGMDKFTLSYLEMPLMVGYTPGGRLGIELGPTVGLNTSAKLKSTQATADVSEVIESFEMGLSGGLRFNISEKVSVAARYCRGLSPMMKVFLTEDGVTGEYLKYFNQSIQASAYYSF